MNDQPRRIVVIKVGGSLLGMSDLRVKLRALLDRHDGISPLLVCGGGAAVDVVRRWQDVHGLTDESAHWLALRAVSLNEALLAGILSHAVIVHSRTEADAAWAEQQILVLAAEAFLRTEEPKVPDPLPHDWSVTSDSIAAWVARRVGAERVVLCKSCDPLTELSLHEAAERGLVDGHFPIAAAELDVAWVNLQADDPQLIAWTGAVQPSRASHV